MGRMNAGLLAVLVAWSSTSIAGAAQSVIERQTLGRQIEQRFVVLPVQGGVVLTPTRVNRDVRSVELTNGAIAINGEPVTGAELRRRLSADADLIIRLSYLNASEQRALFDPRSSSQPSPPAAPTAPTATAEANPPADF